MSQSRAFQAFLMEHDDEVEYDDVMSLCSICLRRGTGLTTTKMASMIPFSIDFPIDWPESSIPHAMILSSQTWLDYLVLVLVHFFV